MPIGVGLPISKGELVVLTLGSIVVVRNAVEWDEFSTKYPQNLEQTDLVFQILLTCKFSQHYL